MIGQMRTAAWACIAAGCLTVGGLSVAARGDLGDLVERLPPHANAIVAVDVPTVLAAKSRGGDVPRSPLPLPKIAGLQGLILSAYVPTASMEPAWEVAVMRVGQKPSLNAVALASGGYADMIEGRPAAWCANDVYCIALDDRTLGAVFPADRQFAARWLGLPTVGAAAGPSGRDYLRAAAARVAPATPVVIALDLKDAVSEAGVRRAFRSGRPEWAAQIPGDDAAAARMLSRVRGVTVLVANLGSEGASGEMAVDFEDDVALLAPAAKSIILGVLAERGLSVPDMQEWQFAAGGRVLGGKGRLSNEGVERLVGFLAVPAVSSPDEPANGRIEQAADRQAAAPGAGGPGQPNAAASRAYYKAVSAALDSFRPGPNLADSAGWLNRNAQRIDQIRADGVDPDLLVFGTDVSSNLREAAVVLAAGQQRVKARALAVHMPAGFAPSQLGVDGAQQASEARAQLANARRQAQQAGAEERANAIEAASKSLQAAAESRGKVRATMSQRYGGGF